MNLAHNLGLAAMAIVLLAAGGAMIFYEWSRAAAGAPLLKGREVLRLYWIAYLTLMVLGVTTGLAAIIR